MGHRMERPEFRPCLYRDAEGQIREMPYPKAEPSREEIRVDVYAPSYRVAKGLFGPAQIEGLEIVIFNTPSYRPDPELEREAVDRLLEAIVRKEGPEVVQASGGVETLRRKIDVGPWWEDRRTA